MARRMRSSDPRLSDQVREAVRASGLSMLAVARGARVDKASMSRFLSGDRGLSIEALDRVGVFLGLRVISVRGRKGARR